jgi:paraquat-inducible protein B
VIWIVPLIAALIGAWMAVRAVTLAGPTITIDFKSAEGLEAGKTRIRFKNVEVGRVESIRLSPDLSNVTVTATMVKDIEPYLTKSTRFWIVRARVAAGEVSGLSTLFSGAYIGMDPGQPGDAARAFRGIGIAAGGYTGHTGQLLQLACGEPWIAGCRFTGLLPQNQGRPSGTL